ncbi:Ccm1p SCDLUD_001525 [Saccharomycodes ludwigii]|uniref:Ccm1p n=1 Tax=Saccharomycodes ludwigii TaxID=36035 RepID=UPI001E84BD15|nr:hypothetical protein SCDLUD_001525 [Saccharomycodes ludwigii]KAH3901751.1 hypothetical protein SCDLUD_001525 [Saccharomycodes ludwigii]
MGNGIIDSDLKSLIKTENSKELQFKIKQLQEFTKNLKAQLKVSEAKKKFETVERENINELKWKVTSQNKTTTSALANSRDTSRSSANITSLITSENNIFQENNNLLPAALKEIIGNDTLIFQCLANSRNRNWNPIVEKLSESSEKLSMMSVNDLRFQFIPYIRNLSFENIERLDNMLMERCRSHKAGHDAEVTRFPMAFFECIFKNLLDSATTASNTKENYEYVLQFFDKLLGRYDKSLETYGADGLLKKFKLNNVIMGHCITYIARMGALAEYNVMNKYLAKFSQYGIQPNRNNYTTLIKFSIDKKNYAQAWDFFDTMKFLSVKEHAPDEKTYYSMLLICNEEANYAKAIDLYNELKDLYDNAKSSKTNKVFPFHIDSSSKDLQPSIKTLSLMALILAKSSRDNIISEGKSGSLRLLGWKYIHEICDRKDVQVAEAPSTTLSRYDKDSGDTLNNLDSFYVLKAMMALASYDGDVGLARALYFKYVSKIKITGSTKINLDPSMFNLLMHSYSRCRFDHIPVLLGYEEGSKLRSQILSNVDYTGRTLEEANSKVILPPFLPKAEILTKEEILMESRALWQFHVERMYENSDTIQIDYEKDIEACKKISTDFESFKFNMFALITNWKKLSHVDDNLLNTKNLCTFLNTAISMDDLREYLLRLRTFSYEEPQLDVMLKREWDNYSQNIIPSFTGKSTDSTFVNTENIKQHNRYDMFSMRYRILQQSEIYLLSMKAAVHFKNLDLGKDIWKKRGGYRKTWAFKNDPNWKKNDEIFAVSVVSFFTELGYLTDAMSVIMSSKKYINWSYPMVKKLHQALLEIEDVHSIEILLDITNNKKDLYEQKLQEIGKSLEKLKL